MATSIHVKKNAKWKNLKVDPDLLSAKHFDCPLSVQELTDYELIKPGADKSSKTERKHRDRSKERLFIDENDSIKKEKKKKVSKGSKHAQIPKVKYKNNMPFEETVKSKNIVKSTENTTSEKKTKMKKKRKTVDSSKVLDLVEELDKQEEEKTNTLKEKKTKLKRKYIEAGDTIPKKKRKLIVEEKSSSSDDSAKMDFNSVIKGMESWKNLFVPVEVLKALKENGFNSPTPIQALVLPHAIRDKLDIVGAAETGSGKTLAFGIPLLNRVFKHRESERKEETVKDIKFMEEIEGGLLDGGDTEDSGDEEKIGAEEEEEGSEEEEEGSKDEEEEKEEEDFDETNVEEGEEWDTDDDSDEANSDEDSGDEGDEKYDGDDLEDSGQFGCVRVIKDADFSNLDVPLVQNIQKSKTPVALVLEPTRELAVQVKNHIQAVSKYSGIKIAIIVGGMSVQKQQRILRKCPDIVVATPGRLWELIQQGEPCLSHLEDVKSLVIDEADRMVEKGHFEELTKLLDHLNANPDKRKRRQTMVFSATLTTVHSGPHRPVAKKVKLTKKDKLEMLMKRTGLKEKPKVIDLTKKAGTVDTLTEARINCTKEEKDLYLYYFLKQYPGRTLVFANSKDCIRRLVSIFTLLKTNPLPLHADMHQKQRLKNLERFTANEKGFLLASDVAARGLDIPNVQHVIHYQVPHTVENYIHRSGRTARASKEGLSVMLIGQEDLKNYRKIIHTLNRNEDLPLFPVEQQYLPVMKQRISLAQQVDVAEHRFKKKKVQNDWFQRAAKEMDMEIDDDELLSDLGDSSEQASHTVYIKQLKAELSALLRQSVTTKTFSGKYPTKSGKLVTPKPVDNQSAIQKVKKDRKVQEKLMNDFPLKPKIIKQKKNKWKKKWKGKSGLV